MSVSEEEHGRLASLRKQAEEVLRGKPVELSGLSSEDIQYMMHELQVHQEELNIQNAELRRIQLELEASRDMFLDLYNFAPAGYCTINRKDRILEANQTLATMIGLEQKNLLNSKLSRYMHRDDQDKYYLYRQRAFEKHASEMREIRLVKQTGGEIYVRLESMLPHQAEDKLLVMLVDITRQRELQHHLVEQREQERQKIARDLHDGPLQALAAVNFALRGILMDQSNPSPELTKSLELIQESLREQIQVLRNYAVDLRPPILTHLGLEKALRSYVENFREMHPQINFRLDLHPTRMQLSEMTSVALFRICQEAFTNITKHAEGTATEIMVRLAVDDHHLRLEIQDNGVGFDVPDNWLDLAKMGHLGLLGMRERADAVGGQLDIQSRQGGGTRIKVTVPLGDARSMIS